jgi:hypothetical protein
MRGTYGRDHNISCLSICIQFWSIMHADLIFMTRQWFIAECLGGRVSTCPLMWTNSMEARNQCRLPVNDVEPTFNYDPLTLGAAAGVVRTAVASNNRDLNRLHRAEAMILARIDWRVSISLKHAVPLFAASSVCCACPSERSDSDHHLDRFLMAHGSCSMEDL